MWLLLDSAGDPLTLLDYFSRASGVVFAVVGIWLFLTDRIVSGTTHRRVLDERDRLYAVVLEHSGITKKVVSLDMERLAMAEQLLQLQQQKEAK